MFSVYSYCQSNFGWKRVIKETTGEDSLEIIVIDYSSEKPIYNAKITFCQNKNLTKNTDSLGKVILPKLKHAMFEVSAEGTSPFEGFDSLCVSVNDEQIDKITVQLEKSYLYALYPTSYDPKGYRSTLHFAAILGTLARQKAEEDWINNNIQLYSNFLSNGEQNDFSNKYGFVFIYNSDKAIEYKIEYNKVILRNLKQKYGDNFESELKAICWCNGY